MGERGSRCKRYLDYGLGIPLTLASSLLRRKGRRGSVCLPEKARMRVVFLCLGAIGDLFLLTALISALRRKLPRAFFGLVTSKANACAAELVPDIDEHKAFGLWQIPQMISYLRGHPIDLCIDSSQWARLGTLLGNFSRAHTTIGFASKGQFRSFGLDIAVPHRSDQHEVENFLDLGRALFPDLQGEPGLLLPSSLHSKRYLVQKAQASPKAIYAHMWPSGVQAHLKEWPEAYWAELLRNLQREGFTLYLTGHAQDTRRNAAFLAKYPDLAAQSLAGEVSLNELAFLFARACAVISVNTGTMHLAALSGAPTIGLHGPTNPLRWGPWGKQVCALLPRSGSFAYLDLGFEYPKGVGPCLQNLPPQDVLAALERLAIG